jgi:hypothetical protein
MSVPPDVLDSCRKVVVGVLRLVVAAGLVLVITAVLLTGAAYVVTSYTFNH